MYLKRDGLCGTLLFRGEAAVVKIGFRNKGPADAMVSVLDGWTGIIGKTKLKVQYVSHFIHAHVVLKQAEINVIMFMSRPR